MKQLIRKIIGYCGFFFFNRINLRLLFPSLGNVIEDWRQLFLRIIGAEIGNNSFVRSGGHIYFPQNLCMGENSKINNGYNLSLFAKLYVGDDVEIGPEFLVYTGEHKFDNPSLLLTKQGSYHAPVHIGNNVYIGARVTVLKGAVIEDRVVVGAGAVVIGRLKSGYIYGGVPAKKIKSLPTDT